MRRISGAKKNLLEALRTYPVVVQKNFCLFHAGEKGADYFDIDRITCNHSSQTDLVREVIARIGSMERRGMRYNKLAFIDKEMGPLGMILLASTFSQKLNKDVVVLRLRETLRFDHVRVKGTISKAGEHPLTSGDSVLLIDDVITTGGTQKDAIDLVGEFDAKVTGIVVALLRNEGVKKTLQTEKGVEFIETVWNYYELVAQGHILAGAEYLLSQNLAYALADELFPRREARQRGETLDQGLEAAVSRALKERHIEVEPNIRQGLKNLYLNTAMTLVQSGSGKEKKA